MECYLDTLAHNCAEVDTYTSSPLRRVMGRCMQAFSGSYGTNVYTSKSGHTRIYTGLDPHSCTSTAALVVHWLCGGGRPSTLEELRYQHGSRNVELFDAEVVVSMTTRPCVILFHTPHHKFCVLCVDKVAVLLHSNQDVFHGDAASFSLEEYLKSDPLRLTSDSLCTFLLDMKLAVTEPSQCQRIFSRYFGIPFRKGPKEEYWFTVVECKPFDEEHPRQ